MSRETDQVSKFYEVIWNRQNKDKIPSVLDRNVSFQGSLGQKKTGQAGFAEYLDMVHSSLGKYQCEIEEMVADSNKVFARMKFSGVHKGHFMGFEPNGKRV